MLLDQKIRDLKNVLKDLDYDEGVRITLKKPKEKIFINKNILHQYVVQYSTNDYNKIKYFDKLDSLIHTIKEKYPIEFEFELY